MVRRLAFVIAALGLVAILAYGVHGLPTFGHYPGPYGDQVVHAMNNRKATNAVTTVVMDVRAVDTAGEELILFAAVVGTLMLLRRMRAEREGETPAEDRHADRTPQSTAVTAVCNAMIAPVGILGIYVVVHGQITPGGGFQGGVVLAGPAVLLFLAGRGKAFDRLHHLPTWETAQGIAVTAFLGFGFAGMVLAHPIGAYLANFLPRGVAATVYSAGSIDPLNVVTAVAVDTAVILVAVELLKQLTSVTSR
jgi:multicomponent Na+:H+ antiporter subunit B